MTRSSTRDANSRPQMMRNRIAAQAAKLMAEDGIADFALAKRKAARQLGAPSTQALPNNDEVEAALKTHRQLYQPELYPAQLRDLRRKALSAMHYFQRYDPWLTGPVLKGSAGPTTAINIALFAANEKEIGLFLLDRRLTFQIADDRHSHPKSARSVCVVCLDWEGSPLHLALYEPADLRGALRAEAPAAAERANIAALERLLAEDGKGA